MTISILGLAAIVVVTAVITFIAAVFIYRNNTAIFAPIAERLDAHEDNLEEIIKDLKSEIKTLNKKVSTAVQDLNTKTESPTQN